LALASTFRVADSAMADSLRESGAREVTVPSLLFALAPAEGYDLERCVRKTKHGSTTVAG